MEDNFVNFTQFAGDDFGSHIQKSIPSYDRVFEICLNLSEYFLVGGKAVDVGCSDGRLLESLSKKGFNATGIEPEHSFYDGLVSKGLNFVNYDAILYDFSDADFVSILFTLQFLPVKKRFILIKKIADQLNVGGGVFIAEKNTSEYSDINDFNTSIYYQFKQESFTPDQILEKEKNLRKIMRINTWNKTLNYLKEAGFSSVDVIWKDLNFTGFVAIK